MSQLTPYYDSYSNTGIIEPSSKIESYFNIFAKYLAVLSALLIGLLIVPICVDVTCRYFFNIAIPGIMEIETLTLVVIAFAAMPFTFVIRQPVQIDIFFSMFSPALQRRLIFFTYILCTVMGAILTFETFRAVPLIIKNVA